jgi:MscS family membrane protein
VRRFRSDAAIVAIKVSQIPFLVISAAGVLKFWLVSENLQVYPSIKWLDRGLGAIIILSLTIWVIRLIKDVVIYALKEFAQTTEDQWDDVLVPFVETTLPIIIYSTGAVLFLQAIGIDLTGLLVALGGITFVLSFAVQKILSDFFAGLFILIDSPFRFGDVVTLGDGTKAVIKKIGLRLTTLYVINEHCDLYVPNASIQSQSITNLSRPTSHYYYTLKLPVKSDADPARVVKLIESVVLAHPDTLGNVEQKIERIESYFGLSGFAAAETVLKKRESGHLRLLAEKNVNDNLLTIEEEFDNLAEKISDMEDGGLNPHEIRQIQDIFLDICRKVGLDAPLDRKQRLSLEESIKATTTDTLIGSIRNWYKLWLQDPNLLHSDREELPVYWEQKISLLKLKLSKAFKKIISIDKDETRVDNLVADIRIWMQENFKTTRNQWQDPKVWVEEVSQSGRTYSVKFYVDDITLENCQRGLRIQSEVNQELTWQLREAYLAA